MESPEDVAWADSCLSKDPDMVDAGWDSLKDALLEGLNSQYDPSPYEREDSSEVANMDIVLNENTSNDIDSVEEKTIEDFAFTGQGADGRLNSPKYASLEDLNIQFQSSCGIDNTPLLKQLELEEIFSGEGRDVILNSGRTPVSIADTSDRAEPSGDASSNYVGANGFWSKHKMQDVFLPTYDESLKDLGLSDPELDFVFQEFKLEQSTEDIFKTWDFDIPSEENDLIKQLNKALAANPPQPTSLFSDDSVAWKGLQHQDRSVDDLISGLADLTLSPKSDQRVLT